MTGAGGYARPSRLCVGRSSLAKMSAVITQRLGSIFMSDENLNRLFMVIAIALMMLIAVMVTGSHAKGGPREGNSPEISEWFRSQHNSLGGCCCNDADGHRYYGHYVLNSDGSVTISPAPRTPTRSSPTRCYPAQTRPAPRCGGTTRDTPAQRPHTASRRDR